MSLWFYFVIGVLTETVPPWRDARARPVVAWRRFRGAAQRESTGRDEPAVRAAQILGSRSKLSAPRL